MKKIVLLSFNLFLGYYLMAQTIVSTTPENKNVVIEEFTGLFCAQCPAGNIITKAIQDEHPDDVIIINVHVYNYATPENDEPDYRTDFGNKIANQSDVPYLPSATVNRHVFSGYEINTGKTGLDRQNWDATSEIILGQSSYVNVAIEADIDEETRELIVHVEAYYTEDSPEVTNKLNIAIMQDSTLGPQMPITLITGDLYTHNNRLVHLITGQWGEDITSTTKGSFIDKTYSYTIPDDYRGVPVVLKDLKVAAFIAEGKQEIVTGAKAYPGTPAAIIAGIDELNRNLTASIYPNPASDVLSVDFKLEKPKNVEIKLYDLSGSLIKAKSYGVLRSGKMNIKLSTSDLHSGMYYLVLDAEDKMAKQKIAVLK